MILKSVEVNSSGKFIYTHFVREKNGAMQTPENLREKPAERKNHDAKREISLNQKDYKEFSALCYKFNSLWFDLFI